MNGLKIKSFISLFMSMFLVLVVENLAADSLYNGKKYSPPEGLSAAEKIDKSKDVYSNLQIDDQYLGDTLPLDFLFTNTQTNALLLSDFFGDVPVVLSFVYFDCPRFCNLVLNAKKDVLNGVKSLQMGKDYRAVTFSINPRDTIGKASEYEKRYRQHFKKNLASDSQYEKSWNFLLGKSQDVKSLANRVGFPYRFIQKTAEYEHPAGIFVLSPSGKICRYFYGVGYNSFDMKLALAEAKLEKERTTVEKILLFCYGYSPDQKGYALQAMRIMRLGGALTVLFLLILIVRLYYSEKKKDK